MNFLTVTREKKKYISPTLIREVHRYAMSDNKHSDSLLSNETTRQRRAWIDRAMAGVRGKVKDRGEAAVDAKPSRPRLYVVGSSRRR